MKRIHYILLIAISLILFSNCRSTNNLGKRTKPVCKPVSEIDYYRSLIRVKDEDFDRDKENIAARETRDLGCLTIEQIKGFTESLDSERNRLSYMKFAYSYCSNPNNYYSSLHSLLGFKRSKMELENWTR